MISVFWDDDDDDDYGLMREKENTDCDGKVE
jgi:hypothetical protein